MTKIIKDILFDEFNAYFAYDESSPSCLVRKNFPHKVLDTPEVCGHIRGGYWKIYHKYQAYVASRVIYCLNHGSVSIDMVVDHIDGNKLNNHIENLRLVPTLTNNRNKKKSAANTTSVTGVTYVEIDNRVGGINRYYRATIIGDSKPIIRSFNIDHYGEQLAFTLACQFREQTLKEQVLYTERHGL